MDMQSDAPSEILGRFISEASSIGFITDSFSAGTSLYGWPSPAGG